MNPGNLMSVRRILLLLVLLTGTSAGAQSTEQLGHVERKVTFEASVAVGQLNGIDDYETTSEPRSASFAIRWAPTTTGGFRLAFHGIERTSLYRLQGFTSGGIAVADTSTRVEKQLAVTLSADAGLRLWRDLVVLASGGVGIIPYAHGELTYTRQNRPAYYEQPYSRSATGTLLTFSAMARYRWLFVEQRAYIMNGANRAIMIGREYYPFSLGVRF